LKNDFLTAILRFWSHERPETNGPKRKGGGTFTYQCYCLYLLWPLESCFL